MALVVDAGYIRSEGIALWRRSFWRIVAFVIVIVGITFLMVRWFLLRPMSRAAERLRLLRTGHAEESAESELGALAPVFASGARSGDHGGEPESGARCRRRRSPPSRSRREPLDRRAPWRCTSATAPAQAKSSWSRTANRICTCARGREIVCVVPPSGLVTALEPVLRACDGVWVASGTGDADADRRGRVSTACACRPTIRAIPCAGSGSQSRKRRATTRASPTRGCGRFVTLRIPGPSFARPTGSAISS